MKAKDPRKPWMATLTRGVPESEARAGAPPPGLGLTSERLRERMVERLAAGGIRDPAVLLAMAAVERHRFVDEGLASRAYQDTALPIACEQTISQPLVVALMTEALLAGERLSRVLEIGTGCGYQTAILSLCCAEVYSIERIAALHQRARRNLRPLRLANVRLVQGDGLLGLPEAAPFDGMLVAAAAADLPQALLDQLRVGARVIAPLGDRDEQALCVITRVGPGQFTRRVIDRVRFVPLLPGVA